MTNREKIVSKVESVQNSIANSEIEVSNELLSRVQTVSDEVEEFKVFLPLIGSFNAGKSSLINSFIEDETLLTNIVPETAVATELFFGKEKIEGYKFDSETPETVVDSLDFDEIDTEEFDYLKVYIPSENLKNLPFTLVDMPGLDSNLERHNRSIFKYIEKATTFVVVLDVEDGTIRSHTLLFLKEIRDYRLDFFTIINKIDKRPIAEVEKIEKGIKNSLSNILENPFVGKVSAHDDDIEDMKKAFSKINVDELIGKLFFNKLTSSIDDIVLDLQNRKDAISLNADEINEKIETILQQKKYILKEFDREKRSVEQKFSNALLSDLLSEVERTLRVNVDELQRAINISQESFSQKVNDIIRPIIVSKIKSFSEKVFSEAIHNIEISTKDSFGEIDNLLTKTKVGLDVAEKVAPIIGQVLSKSAGLWLTNIIGKLNPILAVVTTVVTLISSLFGGESKEDKQANAEAEREREVRDQLLNRIIPSIPSQISPSIEESINEVKDNFFAQLEKDFSSKIDDIEKSLQTAKAELEALKDEVEKKREDFIKLISKLQAI
jgi:GTPase SAR1 family protein